MNTPCVTLTAAIRAFLGALLSVLPALASADASSPSIPDTPAGHALGSWLAAFNSGDRASVESFVKAQDPGLPVDSVMSWREEVGGYDLLAIYGSKPTDITFRVRARTNSGEEIGRVQVTATDPAFVTELGTFRIPSVGTYVGFDVNAATREAAIKTAIAKLPEHYVFPEVGKAMALEIAKRAKQGAYAKTDGESLAKMLTADMQGISHDKHLEVTFRPFRMPAGAPNQGSRRAEPDAQNCAFDRVERFPNNVGYIKFDGFVASNACADVRTAAMAFLTGVDALIFDLRDNRGGGGTDKGPDLLSYLFERPTHLSDIYDRLTGQTTQTWIQPYALEKGFGKVPLYVLTSRTTFSAAEYFTYNLQALKRATVVGEVSGGGANMISVERIDDRFSIHVPYKRPTNPITRTNWDGVGVIPDVKVPASEALVAAEKLAAEELRKRSK